MGISLNLYVEFAAVMRLNTYRSRQLVWCGFCFTMKNVISRCSHPTPFSYHRFEQFITKHVLSKTTHLYDPYVATVCENSSMFIAEE